MRLLRKRGTKKNRSSLNRNTGLSVRTKRLKRSSASSTFPLTSTVWCSCRRKQSEEHTSELQSPDHLVCRLLLEKQKRRRQAHLLVQQALGAGDEIAGLETI